MFRELQEALRMEMETKVRATNNNIKQPRTTQVQSHKSTKDPQYPRIRSRPSLRPRKTSL